MNAPRILIVGFPYVRDEYFHTFRHIPQPGDFLFLLPRVWSAKGGKVVFHAPRDPRVIPSVAWFYHSHYPFIGGLLKGFMPSLPRYLWKYRSSLKLVYSCSEPALVTTLWYGLWAKIFGYTHIVFSWQNLPYTRLLHRWLVRLNLMLADGVICGNEKSADIHRGFTSKPVTVIPMNGVDTKRFTPQPRPPRATVTFTFAGAIGKRKGLDTLIEAFQEVSQRIPHARLVLAGSGEYDAEIDNQLSASHIKGLTTRIPWVTHSDLVTLLQDSDVFVYPSISYGGWEEQFGYSMVEASLMELPVIATRTGSIEEVVVDGVTGVLVIQRDARELATAMIRLAQNPALRVQLGKAGRAYAQTRFSHEVVARALFDFFQSYLKA